jgi:hypothetical protein
VELLNLRTWLLSLSKLPLKKISSCYHQTFSLRFSFSYTHFSFLCSSWKDKGEGSVSEFSGKRIIGVLAGPCETNNASNKRDMDSILTGRDYLKWFEQTQYGDDPCSRFQASMASCEASARTDSPGNGPTAPAAVPRRIGLLAPMRGSAMLVRPCLANRFASWKPSSTQVFSKYFKNEILIVFRFLTKFYSKK